MLGEPEISFSKNKISKKEQNEILGVYRHRPGFVARSRPIRTYGRIQITNKNDNIYIQSRRGPWRASLQIFKSDLGQNIYIVDDGKINPTLISISNNSLTIDRLASLDKDERAKGW